MRLIVAVVYLNAASYIHYNADVRELWLGGSVV